MSKSTIPKSRLIADALERRIVNTVSRQAVALRQADLAIEFGVSHIPVREALAALAQRGLLRVLPNRGALIPPLTAQQCEELARIRAALEGLAVEIAVPRLGPAHFSAASASLRMGKRARTLDQRAKCNWAFHRSIYAAAKMPFLDEQLDRLWRHADRYLRYAWKHAHYEERSDAEHDEILAACRAGDPSTAAALVQAHILRAAAEVCRLLNAGEGA
jgi:DNA-binding GntR family transcriptional regulator